MRQRRMSLIPLVLLLGLLTVTSAVLADPAPGSAHSLMLPLVGRRVLQYRVADRFGVGVVGGDPDIADFPGKLSDFPDVSSLGFGWYSNWSAEVTPERPAGVEYVQLLKTRSWPPNWQAIDLAIRANRGATWIIGNEPEIVSQDNKTPAEYAAVYHEAYAHIKAIDPTARVAIGGVVMPSPLRLLWLEEVLERYRSAYGTKMPVDVWNIHVQILPEGLGYGCFLPHGLSLPEDQQRDLALNHGASGDPTEPSYFYYAYNADPAIFEQLVRNMRAWMAEHDERDKPLIISEYGVLFPSTYIANEYEEDPEIQKAMGDQKVISFMRQTFGFMLTATDPNSGCPADGNRLVQRWLWFSVNVPLSEYNGSLYYYDRRTLTPFGEAYRDYVAAAKAGTLSSLPRMQAVPPSEPVRRSPLPPEGLPDLTKRPPYYGRP